MSDPSASNPSPPAGAMRRKVVVNFGLFAVFFFFYLGAAVIQTPSFADLAGRPVLGMPLGLLASLLVFPVSWILIFIWFRKAK